MKLSVFIVILFVFAPVFGQPRPRVKPTPTPTPEVAPLEPAEVDKQELDAIAPLPPAERVAILQTWREKKPASPLAARALEDLLRARAAWGDELLKAGNIDGGLDQFELVLKECPKENISERLFTDVLLLMPTNLYLRGLRGAAALAAQEVEKLAGANPQRLLPLVTFYLSLEDAANAERVAAEVVKIAPDSAAAQQALGASRHINLDLAGALAGYQKAYELDSASAATRRSLADMLRANGKPEEALALYRKQLETEPKDRLARAGVVLSLLETGQLEEGEKELEAALTDEPRNLPLLAGAAYWHAARGENAKAQSLAERATQIEPRYTWGQIALARALVAQQRPFEAERALRFAQQYGRFPTLAYELATVLAGLGRYEEAAEELAREFTLKNGRVGALLAGRREEFQDDFRALLAAERRAGLFQPTAADTEANARHLKNLLALHLALRPAEDKTTLDETAVSRAAREFGGGADSLALYRQLYAANRLRRAGVAPQAVGALMGAAPAGVDAGLDQPYSVIAIMSDDYLRLSQSGAFANIQPVLTPAQRLAFSRVVRGRIEEMAGWAYLAQNDAGEALVRFRRALSVLPENTSWWRSAQWHQGLALEAQSKPREALAAYIKGYNKNAPDVVRRALIERLYRQVNGNTDGLDEQIGPAPVIAAAPAPEVTPTPLIEATPTPEVKAEATPEDKPAPTPAPKEEPTPEAAPTPEPAPAPKVEVKPEVTPAPPDETTPAPLPTPTPESLPAPTPEATPAPTATPEIKAGAAPETTPTPETTTAAPPSEEPKKGEAAPESAPPETVEKKEQPPAGGTRPRRVNAPESESPADKGKKKDKPKKPGRR